MESSDSPILIRLGESEADRPAGAPAAVLKLREPVNLVAMSVGVIAAMASGFSLGAF
jgi:hypothetical protein